jgi:hypothetical protein
MPNILLTTYCNRECPYCFAHEAMGAGECRDMSFRELVTAADMIVASGRLRAGILGGEPTLHPRFFEMIRYLMERGIQLNVFTNGAGPDGWMAQMDSRNLENRLKFIVNVNFPGIDRPEIRERQENFLRRFAPLCDVGLTFYTGGLDPLFLVEIIRRLNLHDTLVRVGLAQPVVGQPNVFLAPEDYPSAVERIVVLAEAVFERGMRISLDCGFPLCSFTDGQLGRLVRCRASAKFLCRPIVDIAPGLWAWSCFPLTRTTRIRIRRGDRLADLVEQFTAQRGDEKSGGSKGVFPRCEACTYRRRGSCDGGCAAHASSRVSDETVISPRSHCDP